MLSRQYCSAFDIFPALKGEDSSVGQRVGPVSPLATSRLPNGVRRGDTGFVRDTSAPRGVWRVRRPFGRGIRLHRASRSSRRDSEDAPGRRFPHVRARAVPSACLPFMPGGQAQSGEGRFLPAVSPRPRRRPLGNGAVAFVVRADPNPTASFCPLCLPRHTLSGGLIPAVVALLSDSSPP